MEAGDEIDDNFNGADDADGMLVLDQSLPRKNKVN